MVLVVVVVVVVVAVLLVVLVRIELAGCSSPASRRERLSDGMGGVVLAFSVLVLACEIGPLIDGGGD